MNEKGVPISMMSDGTPKGYSFITFEGNRYTIDYKVAGKPADHQIGIYAPRVTAAGIRGSISIYANFYIGSEHDQVMLRFGDGQWKPMKRIEEFDPTFVAERVAWDMSDELIEGRKPGNPAISSHLWRYNIRNSNLKKGTYEFEVKATDMYGRTFTEIGSIRVE